MKMMRGAVRLPVLMLAAALLQAQGNDARNSRSQALRPT